MDAILLDARREVGPDSTATHIPFAFTVESESESLEICFTYAPKQPTDEERARTLIQEGMHRYAESLECADPDQWRAHAPVRNLLTLSLDGPAGFRGCAHRSDRGTPFLIGRAAATPGFIPGAIEAGRWTATISAHLVVTESCTISLRVSAAGGGR
jgi:hypothetical protein